MLLSNHKNQKFQMELFHIKKKQSYYKKVKCGKL